MKSIKGSKTETNLMAAFAGESQARNRYTYFASKAKEEGYMQMSLIFEETANQEKEHAKRLFKFMEGGTATITGTFPQVLSAQPVKTWLRLQAAKIMNGRKCTPALRKQPVKKVLTR